MEYTAVYLTILIFEKLEQLLLGDYLDTKRLRLCQLAACRLTRNHVVGLL